MISICGMRISSQGGLEIGRFPFVLSLNPKKVARRKKPALTLALSPRRG
jgi:hypothetical protein